MPSSTAGTGVFNEGYVPSVTVQPRPGQILQGTWRSEFTIAHKLEARFACIFQSCDGNTCRVELKNGITMSCKPNADLKIAEGRTWTTDRWVPIAVEI